MGQRNEEVGAGAGAAIVSATIADDGFTITQKELDMPLNDKNEELAQLKAENTQLRQTVRLQAQMFADEQRATPFEDAVRSMLKREFHNMTLALLKKLRAEGFFKE